MTPEGRGVKPSRVTEAWVGRRVEKVITEWISVLMAADWMHVPCGHLSIDESIFSVNCITPVCLSAIRQHLYGLHLLVVAVLVRRLFRPQGHISNSKSRIGGPVRTLRRSEHTGPEDLVGCLPTFVARIVRFG
jgi:hypothetical protein